MKTHIRAAVTCKKCGKFWHAHDEDDEGLCHSMTHTFIECAEPCDAAEQTSKSLLIQNA